MPEEPKATTVFGGVDGIHGTETTLQDLLEKHKDDDDDDSDFVIPSFL